MNQFAHFLQAVFVVPLALLPIINPLGGSALFATITGGSERLAKPMARQVAINVWVILMVAMLVGTYVLDFFGISLPIVRIGGGLLVAATGWRMLNSDGGDAIRDAVVSDTAELSPNEIARRSFFPMSFPLTSGPGSIATSIALGTRLSSESSQHYVIGVIVAAIGAAITAATVFLCYRYAVRLQRKLGDVGVIIVARMSAFILLCIGIEMIWAGWVDLNRALAP
ncbi:MAG: MarC family protein [Candidatus Dactylopiibacterium sp.]|nr:MarC family protein [Candidatus Dactylopiibacterium sp.]